MQTVSELIDYLETLDGDMEIVLQKDSEGNGYSPLAGSALVKYQAETTWAGQTYDLDDFDDREYYNEMYEGSFDELPTVVVLYPTN
jgi:hypothetical protein